ncbi:MAG: phosphatidate cytidylyltransferase [Eubacteriales bacterium]
MKQRFITGLLWGSLAILTFVYIFSPLMGILITFFSILAVHEIEKVANVKNVPIMAISLIFAGLMPPFNEYHILEHFHIPMTAVIIAYVILLLSLMLAKYETTKFEDVAIVIFTSISVPFALSTFMLVRDVYKIYPNAFQPAKGFYLVFLGLACAWITDMFAYFVGRKIGKHKMSPKISPKKSIEGAVGGILITIIFNLIALIIFTRFFDKPIMPYWAIVPVTIALSTIGMLGDLSASVIKRNYGAKDFSNFMPGHGGVMDRFDSCLFVFPALYGFVILTQAI